MYSSDDRIIEVFELMDLASPAERERFKKMQTHYGKSRSVVASPVDACEASNSMEWEVQDAELEGNP